MTNLEIFEVGQGALTQVQTAKTKVPRLGRYEGVAQKLLNIHDPKRIFVDLNSLSIVPHGLGAIDLFAGAGGLSLGIQNAGFRVKAAVEISEIAAETHTRNFPSTYVHCGDISDFDPLAILGSGTNLSLVAGGPPCQGFSVAGRRDPNDPRNKLFYEFVRVVEQTKPDYFVMENVPGILTMSGGKVKDAILESFAEIGYPGVSVAVLEAAAYGVPQLRSRAIFIGNRHGLPNPFPAPILSHESYRSIESAIGDLPAWDRIPEINHEWTRHSKAFTKRISEVQAGESLYETFADAYKRQYPGLPSMTVKENHGGTHIHHGLDRCISAREMARLQTFPDDFYFLGGMKKAMWQIGNAVPPRLGEVIARAIVPFAMSCRDGKLPAYERVLLPGENLGMDSLF
jgi:DNA (cytosine-5)-methyltransferase 1